MMVIILIVCTYNYFLSTGSIRFESKLAVMPQGYSISSRAFRVSRGARVLMCMYVWLYR